ncbi:MAG TPA: transposase, partial [Actinoplanes sp.]|nr:transposase [Actinoplanes sp.]
MAHDSSPGEEDDAVALVRVYCGLASADESVRTASAVSQLTVAVVDDAGRLLGIHEVSDDPAGYANLGSLLVERTTGFTDAEVAADSDDHAVTSLLTAAGRPLVVADDDTTDDYAERFADDDSAEEMSAPQAARRAVGLARALQAGALVAVNLPVPRELISYKPVLAAHVAMLGGRHASAVALREVLRELYPAALRAYPDPAHPLAMAVLDLIPEPGLLSGRTTDPQQAAERVAADLARARAGTEDEIISAVTALAVAISESPRRGGVNKALGPSAGETVRHAIAAVRSADTACGALIGTLAARASGPATGDTGRRAAGSRRAAESTAGNLQAAAAIQSARDTGTRLRRPRPEPAAGNAPVTPQPLTTPPVAPEPLMPPPIAPRPVAPMPTAPAASSGISSRPVSVPPPPPGMTPITPGSRPAPSSRTPADTGQPFHPTLTNAAMTSARSERQRTVIPPRPTTRPSSPVAPGVSDFSLPMPSQRPAQEISEPGSRANWPLVNNDDDRLAPPPPATGAASVPPPPLPAAPISAPPAEGRVRPPWQDMPKEPPALRLVGPNDGLDDVSDSGIGEPRPLRLVDGDPLPSRSRGSRRPALTALDRSTTPPVSDEGDGDLLIFAAARSAWFTGHGEAEESPELDWENPNDTGWQAAERAATPSVTEETAAGLPKRVPQANLVPGSPLRDERPLRIVRDAASIAAHTTGYFRGWRRGQEIGG